MKNLTVLSIWAVLVANDCQAWAPSNRATTTTTTRTTSTTNFRRRAQFFSPQVSSSTTTIYATIEDDKTESVADVPLKKEEEASSKSIFAAIPYSELTIGVVKETFDGENRVSQTPDSVANLIKAGFAVIVQSGGMYLCCVMSLLFELVNTF
jgi:hypothetical protein